MGLTEDILRKYALVRFEPKTWATRSHMVYRCARKEKCNRMYGKECSVHLDPMHSWMSAPSCLSCAIFIRMEFGLVCFNLIKSTFRPQSLSNADMTLYI
jgi:hypothetical protein